MTVWAVAALVLSLPSSFALGAQSTERAPLPGPPGLSTVEEFRSWRAPGGKELFLFVWQPRAARDLGPMQSAAEWPATAAGQPVKIFETVTFMGRPQRVLVTYLHLAAPETNAMLYAKGMERSEFEALLGGVSLAGRP